MFSLLAGAPHFLLAIKCPSLPVRRFRQILASSAVILEPALMHFQNRWHSAKFETTGSACDVVAVYFNGEDGPQLSRILLADGRTLERVEKGRAFRHRARFFGR